MFVGQLLFSLNEVNSTNDFLIKKLESERLLEGTIVITKQQTKGKGQRGKSWLSSDGQSLLFSLLLYPKCAIQQQFYLNKAIAVSICQALSEINIKAKIKWPNDIYVGKKKIAGILIENTINSSQLKQSIVGVGLNVNQAEFSSELLNPTSIRLHLGKELDISSFLEVVCVFLEKNYLLFKNNSDDKIDEVYHSYLYRYLQNTSFKKDGEYFESKIIGVNALGLLELEMHSRITTFSMGELTFV